LTKEKIEKWFDFKKSLDSIYNDCVAVKEISAGLDILPVYDRECLNATDTMLKKYSTEEIIEWCKENRDSESCSDYKELIRCDYYLPIEIDK
jgi:hypothetical protein